MEGLIVLVVLALAAISLVLPIVSLALASSARERIRRLEERTARLEEELRVLSARGQRLRSAGAMDTVAPSAAADLTRAPAPVPRAAVPGELATAPMPAPPVAVGPVVSPPVAPAPLPTPPRAGGGAPVPNVPPAAAARPPVTPRPPARPPARPPQPPAAASPGGFDWEGLVGVRLFSAVAGVALVFAAVFFLRYSVERGWLQPPVRVAIGLLTGLALLVTCERKAARRYPVTANALDAAAVSILFATLFAAHALWGLVPATPTFLLLALVAAVAVLLSIQHESLFVAVLGLLGGFATPALLSTGENRPFSLFGYLLMLNVGLAWVARARGWPVLTGLSLVLTTLYQWIWVFKFLDAAQVPLAVSIFVVLPAASLAVLSLARRQAGAATRGSSLEQTALLGAALPLLFAVYLAAVPAYGARFGILFGFLFVVDLSLLAIGLARRQGVLHLYGALVTLVGLGVWLTRSYTAEAWPAVLGILALFVCLYLSAEPLAARFGSPLGPVFSAATFAAPLLLLALPALVALEPRAERPLALFGTAFVLLALIAAFAIRRSRGGLYFLGAFFVVIGEAVWSLRYLTPERLSTALALYSAFALAYLGVPIVARRLGRALAPPWGGGLVLVTALFLLFGLAARATAPGALFGLALLLAILDGGLFVEAAATRLSGPSVTGGFLSWIVLGAWWVAAAERIALLPALAVLTGLALLMVFGHVWARPRSTAAEGFSAGCALGLVAHVFLIAVASSPSLAVPPWSWLAVLLVLTLAFSAAALRLREGGFQAAGVVAAAVVLLVWVAQSPSAGWSAVGLLALVAVAALAIAGIRLAQHVGDEGRGWPAAAAAALFALHFGAILAGRQAAPATPVLAATHLLALGLLLALATARGWHSLGLLAVATSTIALAVFSASHGRPEEWGGRLLLAGALYVVFLAWPFAAGRAAVAAREPWLAAVLASLPFFFAARASLTAGGFAPVIGALPVAQALAMALLLRRLLAIEPAKTRDGGRLALVAGTALAFVTVAIPLQLEKQWLTIGWALEGAALAWLYRRIAHRGLLWSAAGLLGAAFVRLALNPEVLRYAPRSEVPVFNWYLYTYLLCAAAGAAAGWLLLRRDDRLVSGLPRASTASFAAAGVLLFLVLNIEIADFYAEGPTFALRFGVRLAQDLSYTIGWLLFGLALLGVGIATRSRGARLTALALVAVTACKGFLYDLARLGGLYRVASFVGLAIALALVSLALQRFVLRVKESA